MNTTGVKTTSELCLVILSNEIIRRRLIPTALQDLNSLESIEITHIKTMTPTLDLMKRFYDKSDTWLKKVGQNIIDLRQGGNLSTDYDALTYGRTIRDSLIKQNSVGPVVAVILKGPDACAQVREIVGDVAPESAEPETMRRKYSSDSMVAAVFEVRGVENAVHCSEDCHDGLVEIQMIFPEYSLTDLIAS